MIYQYLRLRYVATRSGLHSGLLYHRPMVQPGAGRSDCSPVFHPLLIYTTSTKQKGCFEAFVWVCSLTIQFAACISDLSFTCKKYSCRSKSHGNPFEVSLDIWPLKGPFVVLKLQSVQISRFGVRQRKSSPCPSQHSRLRLRRALKQSAHRTHGRRQLSFHASAMKVWTCFKMMSNECIETWQFVAFDEATSSNSTSNCASSNNSSARVTLSKSTAIVFFEFGFFVCIESSNFQILHLALSSPSFILRYWTRAPTVRTTARVSSTIQSLAFTTTERTWETRTTDEPTTTTTTTPVPLATLPPWLKTATQTGPVRTEMTLSASTREDAEDSWLASRMARVENLAFQGLLSFVCSFHERVNEKSRKAASDCELSTSDVEEMVLPAAMGAVRSALRTSLEILGWQSLAVRSCIIC